MAHQIKGIRYEPYGGGGVFGHKSWHSVSAESFDEGTSWLAQKLVNSYSRVDVHLNGRAFKPTEVTLFFYFNGRDPREDGNWIADKIVEVKV